MKIQVTFDHDTCPNCKGDGNIPKASGFHETQPCDWCDGTGQNPQPKSYTYTTNDDVAVGDKVITPPNDYNQGRTATVVELGSTYRGKTKTVKRADG